MTTANTTAPALTFISLRDLLDVVFRRKRQILWTLAGCVAAVLAITVIMTPQYESQSQILIKVGRENLYIPTITDATPIVAEDREGQINSEVQILTSRFLAEKLIDAIDPLVLYPDLKQEKPGLFARLFPVAHMTDPKLEIRDAALEMLRDELKVEVAKNSSVIILTFRHPDPMIAAQVLNTLDSLYLEQHLNVYQNSQAYGFFDEQAQIFDKKLRESEARLQAFKSENYVSNPEEQRRLLLEQEAELYTSRRTSMAGEMEAAGRAALHRQQLGGTAATVTLEQASEFNPYAISSLQAKLVDFELEAREFGERPPQEIQEQIKLTRERLRQEEAKRLTNSRTGVNTVYQAIQEEQLRSEAAAQALKAKGESETAQLAELQDRLDELTHKENEFLRLSEEVEINRENYRLYITKREESRVSQAMDAQRIANVSVIDPAQPASEPVSPKPKLNALLAVILGLLAGLSLSFLSEYLDNTLYRAETAEQVLALPVLSSIPVLSLSEYPDVTLRQAEDIQGDLRLPVLASTPRLS